MERLFDNLDGSYLPAFLYIQLNENIDFQNFENHSDEVKGTFIHPVHHGFSGHLTSPARTCWSH